MSAKELFEWFDKKGLLKYKLDKGGQGCFYYVKRLLTEMKKDSWFDSNSNTIKKNFETIDSYKKDTPIGTECKITYGIGTFL